MRSYNSASSSRTFDALQTFSKLGYASSPYPPSPPPGFIHTDVTFPYCRLHIVHHAPLKPSNTRITVCAFEHKNYRARWRAATLSPIDAPSDFPKPRLRSFEFVWQGALPGRAKHIHAFSYPPAISTSEDDRRRRKRKVSPPLRPSPSP